MGFGKRKTAKELRLFGLVFGGVMTFMGSMLLWRGKPAGPWVLGLAVFALLSGVFLPKLLRPLEMVLGAILRAVMTVVTYVVLTLAYLLVFTPLGLLMKIFGKDLLDRRFPTDEKSYWVPVEVDGPGTRPDKPY